MDDDYPTKTTFSDIPTEQVWDGDDMHLVRWTNELDDRIEMHDLYNNLVRRGTRLMRNGKTAVDSKATLHDISTGKHHELASLTTLATPYPTGRFSASVYAEAMRAGTVVTPDKYGVGRITPTERPDDVDTSGLPVEVTDAYFAARPIIDDLDHQFMMWILTRVSDRAERDELKHRRAGARRG